jgi:N-methylhydantoinase A/oxoprolinase/acetone carboxylase beta subunit
MRYRLQVHTIEIEANRDELTPQAHRAVLDRFATRYARIYGEGALMTDGRVESELQRVTGRLPIEKFEFRAEKRVKPDASAAISGERQVYFEPAGYIATPIFAGDQLRPGHVISGPAVVQRMGDAIVVPPGFVAEMDQYRTISLKATEPGARVQRPQTEFVSA